MKEDIVEHGDIIEGMCDNIGPSEREKIKEENYQHALEEYQKSLNLNSNESKSKGMSLNDYYIDCQPTGASDEEIVAYQLPLPLSNGLQIGGSSESSLTNFFVFFIIGAVLYITLPIAYKIGIVDLIVRDDIPNGKGRLLTIDMVIFILLTILSIYLSTDGIKQSNKTETSFGIGVFMFLFYGMVIITIKKSLDPNFQLDGEYTPLDIAAFITEFGVYVWTKKIDIIMFWIGIISLLFVPYAILSNDPFGSTISHYMSVVLGFGLPYGLILAAYFTKVLDVYLPK